MPGTRAPSTCSATSARVRFYGRSGDDFAWAIGFFDGQKETFYKKRHRVQGPAARIESFRGHREGRVGEVLRQRTLKFGQKCMTTVTPKRMKELLLCNARFF
jgi:hypothetical protein